MAEQLIGKVTHYFGKANVAGIEITSDFTQKIESMQIDRAPVESAKVGDEIGVRVVEHAREHDEVYRVLPD